MNERDERERKRKRKKDEGEEKRKVSQTIHREVWRCSNAQLVDVYSKERMNTAISLSSLQQNGTKVCCICLEKKPVDIPLINCDHRTEFCQECISQWLDLKKFDCPICRKVWQEKECVSVQIEVKRRREFC